VTDHVWTAIQQYVPTRTEPTQYPILIHEILCSLADVSEQTLNTTINHRNYAAFVSLADATDMLSAAILDLMNHYALNDMHPRNYINEAITNVQTQRGRPEDRTENLTHMIIVLIEEIGEIANAIQTDTSRRKSILLECADAIAVLYNIRMMSLARAGMNQ